MRRLVLGRRSGRYAIAEGCTAGITTVCIVILEPYLWFDGAHLEVSFTREREDFPFCTVIFYKIANCKSGPNFRFTTAHRVIILFGSQRVGDISILLPHLVPILLTRS
jgi:hypothetical protein